LGWTGKISYTCTFKYISITGKIFSVVAVENNGFIASLNINYCDNMHLEVLN
jgi:hypothetical protein